MTQDPDSFLFHLKNNVSYKEIGEEYLSNLIPKRDSILEEMEKIAKIGEMWFGGNQTLGEISNMT